MTKKKKLIKIKYFKFYFISFSLLVGIFSMVLLVVSLSAKNRRVANEESRAVVIEKPVVLEPVTNKITRELSLNGNFSEFKAGAPVSWFVFPSSNAYSPKLTSVTDSNFTYINSSSVLIETKVANSGISQTLPSDAQTPIFIQANIKVVSGKFKLAVVDTNGVEVGSDETLGDESSDWQRLAIGVTNQNVSLKSVRLIATQHDSKAYVTNVVSHPYADYSELFSELSTDSNKKHLSDCDEKSDEEYRQCIIVKTSMEPDRWNEIGMPKMYYKDEEVSVNQLSLGNSQKYNSIHPLETNEMKKYYVKYIYFATDFINKSDPSNPTKFQKQIKDFIQHAWKGEVTKEIITKNAIAKPFDPTIKSECKITGYWSKATAYFPDSWCSDDPELQYAFLRAGGGDGQYQYEQPRIYVDTNGNWDNLQYTIKHETGHFGGSPDTDFVEIRGNSLFREGNSKKESIWADLMYKYSLNLIPSEYTVGIINSVNKFDWDNFYKFQPRNLIIKDAKTNQRIEYGRYNIYDGIWGPTHYKGFIWPNLFRNTGEIMGGVISSNDPPFLQKRYGDVAGFLKIESDGKLFIGKFDLVDLTLAYLRGQDSLEVLVDQIGEGNVAILNPENNSNINSLNDIRIKVLAPIDSDLTNWTLSARVNGEIKPLTSGTKIISGDRIYIPPENLSRFFGFNGKIDLVLEAKFSTGEYYSGKNDDARQRAMREFVLTDIKSNIDLQDKIEITSVKIISRNNILVDGKGFGNSPIFITLYEPLTRRVSKYTDTENYKTNEIQYNYTLQVQNDHIEGFLGDKPYFESKTFTPENWTDKILDITITRANAQSEKYHFLPEDQQLTSAILVLTHPPSSFEYDPPSVFSESLTNHFELKCQQDGTKIILGVETSDNILNHKYTQVRDNCGYNEPIVADFIMENTDAENILESSQNGKYYWFACRVLDKHTLSGSQQNDFSDNPISKMLAAGDSENSYDCASMGRIKLQRRIYDSTPTPLPTPINAASESTSEPPSNLCADGSAPWDYINGRCPESASSSIDYNPAQTEDTPTPTVYYPYSPDGNTQTEY